jgi:hypothetical protein
MNMIMIKRIYSHSAKLDQWLLLTNYTKDQVCSHLTLFVGSSFGKLLFCIFNKSKEYPDHPTAFPPSHPALPSHPLQKPPHLLYKWFLWSILLLHFQQVKGKSWSITMMESTMEANASKIWFNLFLYYFMIHFMADKQCTVCGMWLVLIKWKHTLKVTKQQTHHTSFMTHDCIKHFDISINTTKVNPQKSFIFWSLITSTNKTGPYCSKWGRQAAHKEFVGINHRL